MTPLSEIDFLRLCNDQKPTEMPPHLISEYIQNRRVFPPGSPRPGPIDLHLTPYVIEMMDAAGPYSGINRISVLKGVQIALTTMLESIIAYYMDANPSEIMYCTATESLLRKWLKRLEVMVDSCGYRHKIAAQTEKVKSRKSGDTDFAKEYPGGSLTMTSLQSPAGMRSESNKILAIDEVDAAPKETTTGEGNYLGILDGRTAAYGSSWKVINTSTPATYDGSVIWPEFESGDQRYYNVPCLKCGSFFVFDTKYISPIYDKHGYVERVYHECPSCNQQIWNSDKFEMMRVDHAEWIPTAVPHDKTHRSYQISSLYSPFASWERFYKTYLKSLEDPTLQPSFRNLWEGMPYKDEGYKPDLKKIMQRTGTYKKGTVPDNVIFLTMAADVQRGREIYQRMSPEELDQVTANLIKEKGATRVWKSEKLPRIEFEVMGVGKNLHSWMIDYRVVYGHTTLGAHEGAFKKLRKMIEAGEIEYHKNDGTKKEPVLVFIDASDGTTRQAVFDFCAKYPGVLPVVNYAAMKLKKQKNIEEASPFDLDRYRFKNKSKEGGSYYQLSVNHYKKKLYEYLNTPRQQSQHQAPTFCDFPSDTPEHYFKMLTSEERLEDGSFYNSGVAAESLDCRAYNLAAEDIYLEEIFIPKLKKRLADIKGKNGARRYSDIEIADKVDKKFALNEMINPGVY